jgi:sterol desaturase/sphingolipid hydroxylase (fatty acid hydroxylase superfamily)
MQTDADLWQAFTAHVRSVFETPFDPNQRIYVLYIATSILCAFGVYLAARRRGEAEGGGFLSFLFPRKVWSHPSAWLDLRYFFFHKIIGHFFVLGVGAGTTLLTYRWISGQPDVLTRALDTPLPPREIGLTLLFMLVATVVGDFVSFLAHYLQHKSVFLWQFHKVHHSAEVMHPVSNFREHPVDNLLYNFLNGVGFGGLLGAATLWFGYSPGLPSLLGVPIMHLLFNVAGYNLRHSHIWLRWPGKLSMIFPSPAHHHVHHSCHPDHIDKNFAFMFPVWDVLFKTYHMPEDNRDVVFGIGKEDKGEYTSCLRLYWVPFKDAGRLLRRRWQKRMDRRRPGQRPMTPAE